MLHTECIDARSQIRRWVQAAKQRVAEWEPCTCMAPDGVHTYDCPAATKADL
jgi:hypothetical protein